MLLDYPVKELLIMGMFLLLRRMVFVNFNDR